MRILMRIQHFPNSTSGSGLGLGTELRSEKIHGIDSERFPLFRERKCSFRGILSSTEEPIPKLRTERKNMTWMDCSKLMVAFAKK
jgi:hypothetical protein